MSRSGNFNGCKTTLDYLERDGKCLVLHRTKNALRRKRTQLEAERGSEGAKQWT